MSMAKKRIPKKHSRVCVDCKKEIISVRFKHPVEKTRCRSCATKGANNPHWKGGTITQYGYQYVWKPDHPKACSRGYVKRANLVWEQATGHYPMKGEILHHKDRNKHNDDLDNLQLMTHSEHARLHASGENNPGYKHGRRIKK